MHLFRYRLGAWYASKAPQSVVNFILWIIYSFLPKRALPHSELPDNLEQKSDLPRKSKLMHTHAWRCSGELCNQHTVHRREFVAIQANPPLPFGYP
jgi:hypothetical protein